MSTILKCDITGKTDVSTVKVNIHNSNDYESTIFDGERLQYSVEFYNQNGYSAIDVAEEYVLQEMIRIMTQRLNELRNPAQHQTKDGD